MENKMENIYIKGFWNIPKSINNDFKSQQIIIFEVKYIKI